jgi:Glucanosyltransferase
LYCSQHHLKDSQHLQTVTIMPAPIGPNDIVTVHGKYLVKQSDGSRFIVKGIAFPVSLNPYNARGWQAVLYQLHEAAPEVNTIRVYSMDPTIDYSAFFHTAAKLGIYILVPLTSADGHGVLDRNVAAPFCYSSRLFDYGRASVDNYGQYPNALAGVIANEVMNSLLTWQAAPCILAYARDLKAYHSRLPLMYTAQHDSIGAAISASQAMKLTMDYLTCDLDSAIDIFGINIESWCSSTQQFDVNEDGSVGTYKAVHDELANATRPVMFSEMGCSLTYFNKDNGLAKGARDWAQVSVVLGEDMIDAWSGFCAYAYDGNVNFNMMAGGPWNGETVLKPNLDFEKFVHALKQVDVDTMPLVMSDSGEAAIQPSCDNVAATLLKCCDLTVVPIEQMPCHFTNETIISDFSNDWHGHNRWPIHVVMVVVFIYVLKQCIGAQRRKNVAPRLMPNEAISLNGYTELKTAHITYQSINSS